MTMIRRTAAAIAVTALLGTAATPAMAGRGHHHRPYHHHHHRGGGGDGFGTFLGIAALIGAVAIVASSADKNARAKDRAREPSRTAEDEDRAVDDCALAARDEAERQSSHADVASIGEIRAVPGGWNVDGTVELRERYRDAAEVRRFSCDWRDGRVANVYLSRDVLALR